MKTTDFINTLHFTRPLRLDAPAPRPGITRPFLETPRRPAIHDLLLVNAHHDIAPETTPVRELGFFNLDLP